MEPKGSLSYSQEPTTWPLDNGSSQLMTDTRDLPSSLSHVHFTLEYSVQFQGSVQYFTTIL